MKTCLVFIVLLCVVSALTEEEARQIARQYVANKNGQPQTKSATLKSVANKLKGIAATQPETASPEKQATSFKDLNEDELKRVKALFNKMNSIAETITSLLPTLEKDRLTVLRDGRTAVDHLRDAYGKLEQLKPQFSAVQDQFPEGKDIINTIKMLEKVVKAVLEDEEKAGAATVAQKEHLAQVEKKAAAARAPTSIPGAECAPGPCCDSKLYKFLPAGTGCQASECVTATTCIGVSDICPDGTPLPDGTACSKGRCLSGVCVREKKLNVECSTGTCCDVEQGTFKTRGTPCSIPPKSCVTAAALCSGESATCDITALPDGALCAVNTVDGEIDGTCSNGECVVEDIDFDLSKLTPSGLSNEERQLLADKRAELKAVKRRYQYKELKHLVRRFGVLLWMGGKLDTLKADKTVADYLNGVPGAVDPRTIFAHQRIPTAENKLWSNYMRSKGLYTGEEQEDTDELTYVGITAGGLPVDDLIDTESSSSDSDELSNLKESNTNSSDSSIYTWGGLLIIGIALVLIVVYFAFGGKKKQPQVIY